MGWGLSVLAPMCCPALLVSPCFEPVCEPRRDWHQAAVGSTRALCAPAGGAAAVRLVPQAPQDGVRRPGGGVARPAALQGSRAAAARQVRPRVCGPGRPSPAACSSGARQTRVPPVTRARVAPAAVGSEVQPCRPWGPGLRAPCCSKAGLRADQRLADAPCRSAGCTRQLVEAMRTLGVINLAPSEVLLHPVCSTSQLAQHCLLLVDLLWELHRPPSAHACHAMLPPAYPSLKTMPKRRSCLPQQLTALCLCSSLTASPARGRKVRAARQSQALGLLLRLSLFLLARASSAGGSPSQVQVCTLAAWPASAVPGESMCCQAALHPRQRASMQHGRSAGRGPRLHGNLLLAALTAHGVTVQHKAWQTPCPACPRRRR